ncbi:MAG TPA: helix-turn-helix transcriptional regulator [Longimicrobium sp.]|nr:helix-turn-helix transcriptional regulator [Longimicrobium sp.]
MTTNDDVEVYESSGNVFADLGLPDAEERLAKAMISRLIANAIRERGLTQSQAATLLGTTQPKVSALVRGQLAGFSMDRLFRFLTVLGMNVRVEVDAALADEPGHLLVATPP